jgi:hypothetical protein
MFADPHRSHDHGDDAHLHAEEGGAERRRLDVHREVEPDKANISRKLGRTPAREHAPLSWPWRACQGEHEFGASAQENLHDSEQAEARAGNPAFLLDQFLP